MRRAFGVLRKLSYIPGIVGVYGVCMSERIMLCSEYMEVRGPRLQLAPPFGYAVAPDACPCISEYLAIPGAMIDSVCSVNPAGFELVTKVMPW